MQSFNTTILKAYLILNSKFNNFLILYFYLYTSSLFYICIYIHSKYINIKINEVTQKKYKNTKNEALYRHIYIQDDDDHHLISIENRI